MIADELRKAKAQEELILTALTETYQRGEMHHLHYGPAYDVTAARAAALSFAIAAAEQSHDR